MIKDGFPCLVTERNVAVEKSLTEDYSQPLKLQAFNDTNGLITYECEEGHKVILTHLVIHYNKRNKVIKEHLVREPWD